MTLEQATFAAALVGALAALLTAIMSLVGQWRAEARGAVRDLLREILPTFGEALHSLLACTTIVLRRAAADQEPGPWQEAATKAAEKLKDLRPKLKYPLWGMAEPIRVLARLPDWAAHLKSDAVRGDKLLALAEALRENLDACAWRAFRRGRTPSRWERWRCASKAGRVRDAFSGDRVIDQ